MSLADVMGAAGLHAWAEIGLVISLITFVAIVAWVFLRRKSRYEHVRRLPLEDDGETRSNDRGDRR